MARRLVQPFLHGSRLWQRDRPTDHTSSSVTIGRIWICSTAMQPKNTTGSRTVYWPMWQVSVELCSHGELQQSLPVSSECCSNVRGKSLAHLAGSHDWNITHLQIYKKNNVNDCNQCSSYDTVNKTLQNLEEFSTTYDFNVDVVACGLLSIRSLNPETRRTTTHLRSRLCPVISCCHLTQIPLSILVELTFFHSTRSSKTQSTERGQLD